MELTREGERLNNEAADEIPIKLETPRDSLKKRYVFKIVSNFVGLISNIVVQAIAPRSLGPQAFGNFNFLTNFFDQVMEMADGKSSVGALVKVSLRPHESGIVVFYLYFAAVVSTLVFIGVGTVFALGIDQIIWPGQTGKFIVLAAIWSVIVWLHGVLQKLCDGFGFTREAEWVRIQQKVLAAAILSTMFFLDKITLESFFYYYIGLLVYLFVGFAVILVWRGKWPPLSAWAMPFAKFKGYAHEFFVYASPLFVFVAVEAIVAVLDRWILQRYSGSEEQGYFGFAYQMGYISVLFVGAFAPLIQREFSVAHAAKNYIHMAYLFRRYMPMLFSISAFFTGFIAFQSDKLIRMFAGHQFTESLLVITTMAFYPIYFTFGRVTSSVFYATGRTQLFRNLGVAVYLAGLVMTWFMVAPKSIGGLGMGAMGLAIKLVLVQAILVNLQVWFSCRILHIQFREYFWHQTLTLLGFLGLGWTATRFIDDVVIRRHQLDLPEFLVGGVAYCLFVGITVYVVPSIFGVRRTDITQAIHYALRLLRISTGSPEAPSRLKNLTEEAWSYSDLDTSTPLRIVLVGAGTSVQTVRWANAMSQRGHDIHFVTMHEVPKNALNRNVHLHQLRFQAPMGYVLNVPALNSFLKQIAADVIHVHYASGYGTLTNLATSQKFILSASGSDVLTIPSRSLVYGHLVRRALARAHLVTVENAGLGSATEKEVRGAKPVYLIPYGVDIDEFSPRHRRSHSSTVRIGLLKALEQEYGIDVLVRAFAEVRKRLKRSRAQVEVELILVGKGSQLPLLRNMTESLGIADCTSIRGSIASEMVPRVLGEMDIFVAPARSESFGLPLVEAMATGLPVVATPILDAPEIIRDGVTGLLFEKDNVSALSDLLWDLVLNEGRRKQLGEAARDHIIRHYSWQTNVAGMERLYYRYRDGEKNESEMVSPT